MAVVLGETVTLGVGLESTRGTAVTPTYWIPAKTPTGIKVVVDMAQIKEARGTGIGTQGSEVVRTRAEGDVEFNVRAGGMGYILKSLLGSVNSVSALGATTHTFNVTPLVAQHPSLTLGLSVPGQQDYRYALSVVSQLELNTPIDDVVTAKASFVGASEATVADYTPAFADSDSDPLFRNHDVTIKIATDVSGLGAATPICIKESSLNFAFNTRPNNCVGSVNPVDILSLLAEITGSFTVDYDGEAYHDLYLNQTYRAMEIKFLRDDLPVIGTSALYPALTITLPKVSFDEYGPERPLDDIVTEAISYTAHYDATAGYAARAVLVNDTASY